MPRQLACTALFAIYLLTAAAVADSYPPGPGTDRESNKYLDATQAFLSTLELEQSGLEFERLGGTTATNWKVSKNGQIFADLKCTSGNTDHRGAVIAYRLGRRLGFNIYPVAVYRDVDLTINGRRVNEQCALKEWSTTFTQYYWTRDTFGGTDSVEKQKLIGALRCDAAKPQPGQTFSYAARSAYGNPTLSGQRRVRYSGEAALLDAARDFSNMMVIDTLIGNEDRFPGGNMFFRSVNNTYVVDGGTVDFAAARLYSLDNEAAFKGATPRSTYAARDLARFVTRFDARMIDRLRELAGDGEALAAITDGSQALKDYLLAGIEIVLNQYDAAIARCGADQASF